MGKIKDSFARAIALNNNKKMETISSKTIVKQITNRGNHYNDGVSNGSENEVTFKFAHIIRADCYDIQVILGNYGRIEESLSGLNDIAVKCSLEFGSDIYVFKFNGEKKPTINVGCHIVSEPIGIELKTGDEVIIRTYVEVGVGEFFPEGLKLVVGDGKVTGDFTESGTIPDSTSGNGYHPVMILGKHREASVYLTGDSIMSGTGDDVSNWGFAVRALRDFHPITVQSTGGEKAQGFDGKGRQHRGSYFVYGTHSICNYGVNDLIQGGASVDVLKERLLNIWNAQVARGMKVYQCTITPVTDSTDGWTTLENQTVETWESNRVEINDWIRTTPSPLSGYYDNADVCESSRNSGLWDVSVQATSDGVHPKVVKHVEMSELIDPNTFNI